MTEDPKMVLHHDDPPCNERLVDGWRPKCRFTPDMQSTCLMPETAKVPKMNVYGPADVVARIAAALRERAASHRRVTNPPFSESDRQMQSLARECDKIADHLEAGRDPL